MAKKTELASELEYGLQGTVDWGRKWLVDFNVGKTHVVVIDNFCLVWSNNIDDDVKM